MKFFEKSKKTFEKNPAVSKSSQIFEDKADDNLQCKPQE